ncbi:MAG: tetratricopeptide repeat protein [Armatimonadetes bacterium]|nr:tetratricopeptide repeat protein [Armatimonadota bacterium]
MDTGKKLVFAPWGAGMFGEDVLLFEHGLLFAMETTVEAAGLAYADIHDQVGGADKRERPTPPLAEADIRALAARAGCDALVDGMLSPARDPQTGALAHMTVSPRLFFFFPRAGRFEAPGGFTFSAFDPDTRPEILALDYDLYIALQYRLCAAVFDALNLDLPPGFTTDRLQITPSWDAYLAFLKGKRLARTAETKLGYYEQALRHDPDFFLALLNSAMLYKTQTDYHAARSRLLRAASATRDSALLGDVHFELGLCSIYLGDPKTARNFWEKALEYGVENPSLYVNMAGTYEQEENLPDAIRLNEEALERFPDHHKAIVNLARLYAMRGQLDRAIPLYERALELQPDDALRLSVLGGCYLAAGREDDARRRFERAVELDAEGDPGKYARQELEKLGPVPAPPKDGPEKKRWGLF